MKGSRPKMMPKGKMSMKKWESSAMDKKMDKAGIAAYNKKTAPKKKK
jgi:hypothetical protein